MSNTKVQDAIEKAAFEYCDDVKRATGDTVLSPELLSEIMTRIARLAATEAFKLGRECNYGSHMYDSVEHAVTIVLGEEP